MGDDENPRKDNVSSNDTNTPQPSTSSENNNIRQPRINFDVVKELLLEVGINWDNNGATIQQRNNAGPSENCERVDDPDDDDGSAVTSESEEMMSLSQEQVDSIERALDGSTLGDRKRQYKLLLDKLKDFHDHGDLREAQEKLQLIKNRQHELYAYGLTPELARYDAEIISLCFNMIEKSLRLQCGLDAEAFSLQSFAHNIRRHLGKDDEEAAEVVEVDVTTQDLCHLLGELHTQYQEEETLYNAACARRAAEGGEEEGVGGDGGEREQMPATNFLPDILTIPPLTVLPTMSFLRFETCPDVENSEHGGKKPRNARISNTREAIKKISTTESASGQSTDEEEMKQKMKAALFMLSDRGKKPVPLYQVVLDRLYMTNTSKNLLVLSFLIQEGFAALQPTPGGTNSKSSCGPLVLVNTDMSDEGKERFRERYPSEEMIVTVDHKLHTRMILECERLDIVPVLYQSKPAPGQMTDWGPYTEDEGTMMKAFIQRAQEHSSPD